MTDYSFRTLHSDGGARVIFRGVVGSRAYGTDRPGSDEDLRLLSVRGQQGIGVPNGIFREGIKATFFVNPSGGTPTCA